MKNHHLMPGVKAVRLDQLPAEAWTTLVGDRAPQEAEKLYRAVAWLYRAVDIRAQAVANMPWELRRGENVVATSDDPASLGEWEWVVQLAPLLYRTEAATVLEGKAYWHKRRPRPQSADDLRWLAPHSITPKYDERAGVASFKRRLKDRDVTLPVKEVVHFWPPDPYVEIGPQVNTPAMAALSSAGVLHNLEEFVAMFFGRGAVKATLLTYQEMVSDDEKTRVKEWWQRVVAGLKNAFSAEVVRGDFEPIIIGEGLESLSNTELTEMEREAISTALGVPQSKLTANASNFATKQSDDKMFIEDLIAPRCAWLASVVNEQLFGTLGVSLVFTPQQLSVMQEDEEQRAASLLNLVNAGMNLEMAVEVLGYDLPDGMELREPKPDPPPAPPPNGDMGPIPTPTGDPPEVAEEKATLRRWLKNRSSPNLADFETDILTDQQKALVALEMGIYGGGSSQDTPFGKATRDIPERDPLNPDGREMRRLEREFEGAVYDALQRLKRNLRRGITEDTVRQMLQRLNDPDIITPFRDTITAQVQRVALAGADFGRKQVEREVFGVKRIEDALEVGVWDIANNDAAEWALQYGYDLVGGITNTTRDRLAREIDHFVQNKETLPDLIGRVEGIFGKSRANTIAVTEVTRSYAQGNVAAWKAAGVVERKEWRTANDELVCQICGPRHQLVVRIDDDFDGIDNPPAHPNCRCWVVPMVEFVPPTPEEEIALIESRGFDPFENIRPPEGRAPRGKGPEYQARRSIVSRIRTHIKWRSQARQHLMEYRGQTGHRIRWQIDQAQARYQELDKGINAALEIANTPMGDWDFKKELIDGIFDHVSAQRQFTQ